MNTALVVLTSAVSANGAAAYLASGSGSDDNSPPTTRLPTIDGLVAKSGSGQTVKPKGIWRQSGRAAANIAAGKAVTPAPRNSTDIDLIETRADDQACRHNGSINVVRYDVPTQATQK
ncbi:hypothetical protein [Bradyrhizobium sp. dw_78]|uniref:hypothetical protein n=1 Tax=Bradyrhizobium sp. dw_78 TaxID=2719793 RepID=UPI001BD33FBB|nr:hypothetical protein [Bradyrhizobium sp. dw_78]